MDYHNYKKQTIPLWWREKNDNFFHSIPNDDKRSLRMMRRTVEKDFSSFADIFEKVSANYAVINNADYTNNLLFRFLGEEISKQYGTTASFDTCFYIGNEIAHIHRNEKKLVLGKHHIIILDFYPVQKEGSNKDKLWRITVKFGLNAPEDYIIRAKNITMAVSKVASVMPSHHKKREKTGISYKEIEMTTLSDFIGELVNG